jgi:hypothetical protein
VAGVGAIRESPDAVPGPHGTDRQIRREIPVDVSVANGLAIGFISHTLIRVFSGHYREISRLVYALTIIFIARFLHLRG